MSGLDYASFQENLISHAKTTGLFDKVAGHEMKNGPGQGVHCEIFTDTIDPARSGLAATSIRLGIKVRVRTDMLGDPQDGIDPRIVRAAGEFMASVTADFEVEGPLGSLISLARTGSRCRPGPGTSSRTASSTGRWT
jgi:hypothetical protein